MSGTEVAVDRIRLGQGAILGQHVADQIIDTIATDRLTNLLVKMSEVIALIHLVMIPAIRGG